MLPCPPVYKPNEVQIYQDTSISSLMLTLINLNMGFMNNKCSLFVWRFILNFFFPFFYPLSVILHILLVIQVASFIPLILVPFHP